MESSQPILLFDGDCGMCNRFVQWVLNVDPEGRFLFAPLNGKTSLEKLGAPVDLSSMILFENGRAYRESDAMVRILSRLRFPWKLGALLFLVPSFLRNAVYRAVARRRHRFTAFTAACRLPTASERARLLP